MEQDTSSSLCWELRKPWRDTCDCRAGLAVLRLLGLCCQQAWLCKFLLSSGFRFMLELSGQAGVLGMDPELFSFLPHSVPQSFAELKVNKKLWLRCPHTDCPLVKVCESCCSPALVADGCWFVIRSVTYMQRAGLGWRCPFWRVTVGLTATLQELVGVCISLAHDVKTGKEDEIQKTKMLSSSFPLYIYF